MGSYVDNNLMPGEEIVYKGKISLFVFLPGAALVVLSGAAAGVDTTIGGLMGVMGVFLLLNALVFRMTTELAITTRRVICKRGLIRRSTAELNHSRVESFNVDQSILGRIFDYGTLSINGTGGGQTPIRSVDAPLEFRKRAMQVIDAKQGA